jgi:hypothetical protein
MRISRLIVGLLALAMVALPLQGCDFSVVDPAADPTDEDDDDVQVPVVDRHAALPIDVVKVVPAQDPTPPILHSSEFQEPVSLPLISTAGAEDAPFIPAGRNELYFFFAADVRAHPSVQIQDPVNGIWVSRSVAGTWQEPTLVWLQDPGEAALNGCPFVGGSEMYFCSARVGYVGVNWFLATEENGIWQDWRELGFNPDLEVGELHIHGDELYYHSGRAGGVGGVDIWMLTLIDGLWQNPVNLEGVNSDGDESRPFLTADGSELWITRTYEGTPAVYRSKKSEGEWQEPELIVSQFAGEPTLDAEGNLYFVHHFFQDNVMIEADIYVANRN